MKHDTELEHSTGTLEQSLSLYLTIEGSSDRPEISFRTCHFAGGRSIARDGHETLFSGLTAYPSRFWPGEPRLRFGYPELSKAIRKFISGWSSQVQLQYQGRVSKRCVIRPDKDPKSFLTEVWALSGNAVTPHGHDVPIGLSGGGLGWNALNHEPLIKTWTHILQAIDVADTLCAGATAAVLAPNAAAVLIHEAVGHFAEASPSSQVNVDHRLGVRLASELFNIYDDPRAVGGPAYYEVDDEGVDVEGRTQIMQQGCLTRLLHSRESAACSGVFSTANGRASVVWDPPIPRMSNLICEPGELSEEAMLEDMGRGLYIHSLAFGYGFGLKLGARIRLAEQVEEGRRTGRFLVAGRVEEERDVLLRAVALGNKSHFNSNAMCGKGQQLLYDVGTQAPAIQISKLRIIT